MLMGWYGMITVGILTFWSHIPVIPSVHYLAFTNLAFLCLTCGIPPVTTISVAGPPLGRKIERKGALPRK